eukprot:c24357_g1_i3 orf=178-570(-)
MGTEFHDWIPRFLQSHQYSRINSPRSRRKRLRLAKLGDKRRSWRLKLIPKLRLLRRSPLRFLSKLRDAYVNMMVSISSKVCSPELVMGHFSVWHTAKPSRKLSIKEYERSYFVELCKAINSMDVAVITHH